MRQLWLILRGFALAVMVGGVLAIAVMPAQALADAAGQLYAFGANDSGQLGNPINNNTNNPNPTPALVSLPAATGPVVQVADGHIYSLALTSTGQLYAFGENTFGELGNSLNSGTSTPNPTPTLVSLPGATGPVVQIAAGYAHSLALTSTGQLYAFGFNQYGQLGNTTNNNTTNPNPTPTLVSLPGAMGPVVQIAAGTFHSLALTSTGQLYAFGDNNLGELGNTTNNGTTNPNPTPTLVSLPAQTGQVVQIAAGRQSSLVVTSTGQLYAFGLNMYGELGNVVNNGTANPNPTPALVALPGATGSVVQIGTGRTHSLAVTSTGQLYAFGDNESGELGNATNEGTTNPNPTPALVSLPGGATVDTVSRGEGYHTLVVLADLAVATTSLAGGTVGVPYRAHLQASGGTPPYDWSASGLPSGLTIDSSTGLISGTPTHAGSFIVQATAADDNGIETSSSLALPIAPAANGGGSASGPVAFLARVSTSGPIASLTIACAGLPGERCSGGVRLTVREHRRGRSVVAVSAGGRHKRGKVVTIIVARRSYSVAAGTSRVLRVPLNATGKQLLATFYTMPARVTLSGTGRGSGVIRFSYPVITSDIRYTLNFTSSSSTFTALSAIGLPRRATVQLICRGGGCPFARRVLRPHGGQVNLTSFVSGAPLSPGTLLRVEITAANRVGEVRDIIIVSDAAPIIANSCLPPGASQPKACR